jgi:hypothetical protein
MGSYRRARAGGGSVEALAVAVILGCLGVGGLLALAGMTRTAIVLLWTGLGLTAAITAYLIADALTSGG